MDIKELRIGNIVKIDDEYLGPIEGKVTSLKESGEAELLLSVSKGNGRYFRCGADDIFPIPITEELLLNNGFDRWGEIFYKDGFECARDGDKWCMSCNCFEYYLARLNGIHQLQNAYYLVTGKELEIKV